jgi:NTP pyrophosphatase (non-canonical NTP hydrolase)
MNQLNTKTETEATGEPIPVISKDLFCVGLSDAERERLAILAEECGEVIQIIGKVLRHGYESRHPNGGPTNRELLESELAHVGVAKDRMCRARELDGERISKAYVEKYGRANNYLHFQ